MIDIPATILQEKRSMLADLVARLSQVPGMAAVVLGGSYASGTQHAESDIDIGLYYSESAPFSIADIRQVAEEVSTVRPATVTGFYEWGAWVNGGAWNHTAQGKVDFLYRSLDQVHRTIAEARQGISHHDYDQQPAYGFYSVIYLAETQVCVPLYDPTGAIAALKSQVETYPPKLKEKVVADSLWSAEFTLLHGRGFAAKGDVYNTAGCLTRAAANLTQALFALNGVYFMRDKKVMETMAGFHAIPSGYAERVNRILSQPGGTVQELSQAVANLEALWRDVVALPGVQYKPSFQV